MNINNGQLSPIQIAYIIGRTHYLPLGGVGMHDFRVFNGDLDGQILHKCLLILVQKYAALRTLIDADSFSQKVLPQGAVQLTEICFRDKSRVEAVREAGRLIAQYEHYVHALKSPPWQLWLIQLPDGEVGADKSMLMVSFDALILDGYAISKLLSELFEHYDMACLGLLEEKETTPMIGALSEIDFFENKPEDAVYWQQKVQTMTQEMDFPWLKPLASIICSKYKRQTKVIDQQDWQHLSQIAAKQGILPNALLNGIILQALAAQNEGGRVYVAVPVSLSLYQEHLSNHSTVLAITYEGAEEDSFFDRVKVLQAETFDALAHISFSGIEIARLICDQMKTSVPFPIVLTNGLSWQRPPRREYIRYTSGQTQTPQVAMDVRSSYAHEGHLLIDVDYAVEAVSEEVVASIHEAITRHIDRLLL